MGEIEWNVGWKNGKSGVGWMPDDTIKNQRPRQMRRRLWKCVSDFVLEVLKIAEKTLGIYKLPLLADAINDRGERRNHTLSGEGEAGCGMHNAEFGIKDGATVPHTAARREALADADRDGQSGSAYRRAQGGAAFRVWRTLIQKRDICGAAAAPAPVYGGRGQ